MSMSSDLSGSDQLELPEIGYTVTVSWEDPRYPTMVVTAPDGSITGWSMTDMSRVCVCVAWEDSECCCGVWDEEQDCR